MRHVGDLTISENPTGIKWFQSIRVRLLAIALLPMLVLLPLFGTGVIVNWSQRFDNLLIAKVNGELTIAHQFLAGLKERSGEKLQSFANSVAFANATPETLPSLLEDQRQRYGFDFLYYIKNDGNIITATSHNAPKDPDRWPVIISAHGGQVRTEIDIFSQEDLADYSDVLAARARIPLVPTKAALATNRTEENRGMIVHSAAPVEAGGVLVSGLLLNQNLEFIDTINDLVYPTASLTEGSRGTTTLFLEDVRISTNVRLFENTRALGTRVSVVVRAAVLEEGVTWLDRAFVVNDWYISAYEPLLDSFGGRVGMLYVGFLDSPFRAAKTRSLVLIAGVFLLLIGLSVPLFLSIARGIFKPLEQMVSTISKVEAGDLSARSKVPAAQNEIAVVSNQLDTLLEQVQERNRQLSDWASELNARVEERTKELKEAGRRLEATSKQLIVSEKLASIGEITASIAHEINNPIAVIQGNIEVIRQELGETVDPLETEFNLVEAQIHSIHVLVSKLLQFARPEEYAGVVDYTDPNDVIRDTLPLVQHLLAKGHIDLVLELKSDCTIAMNHTELQQVLINLIVNAIHAIQNEGRLQVRTKNHNYDGVDGVSITVSDTGSGVPEEVIAQVFDPFFTTKAHEGTGLGLSISQKLVIRSGGQIQVESTVGSGTTFTIFFPSIDVE
ncbi:MAG: cache domain-containing protein [Amylibacter sp.]|nr:cache domain-containing protein [Amylibacter sp.]